MVQPAELPPRQPGPDVQFEMNSGHQFTKQSTFSEHAVSAPRGVKTVQKSNSNASISADLVARWMIIIHSVGSLSQIWQDYHLSNQFTVHCQRLLEKFAPSTLFKYISTLQCIYTILLDFSWTWTDGVTQCKAVMIPLFEPNRKIFVLTKIRLDVWCLKTLRSNPLFWLTVLY